MLSLLVLLSQASADCVGCHVLGNGWTRCRHNPNRCCKPTNDNPVAELSSCPSQCNICRANLHPCNAAEEPNSNPHHCCQITHPSNDLEHIGYESEECDVNLCASQTCDESGAGQQCIERDQLMCCLPMDIHTGLGVVGRTIYDWLACPGQPTATTTTNSPTLPSVNNFLSRANRTAHNGSSVVIVLGCVAGAVAAAVAVFFALKCVKKPKGNNSGKKSSPKEREVGNKHKSEHLRVPLE